MQEGLPDYSRPIDPHGRNRGIRFDGSQADGSLAGARFERDSNRIPIVRYQKADRAISSKFLDVSILIFFSDSAGQEDGEKMRGRPLLLWRCDDVVLVLFAPFGWSVELMRLTQYGFWAR